MKERVVIFDSQSTFAERLINYMECDDGYTTRQFTIPDKLEEYMKGNPDDFYLLEDTEYGRKLFNSMNIKGMLLTEDLSLEKSGIIPCIYRYKPAKDIVDAIKLFVNGGDDLNYKADSLSMYGLFAPLYTVDMDSILQTMSYIASKDMLVLDFRYFNIWDIIHMADNESYTTTGCMADLIYMLREKVDRLDEGVARCIYKEGNISVIYGMTSPQDYLEIEAKDIDGILSYFADKKLYKKIFVVLPVEIVDIAAGSVIGKNMIGVIRGGKREEVLLGRLNKAGVSVVKKIDISRITQEFDAAALECKFQLEMQDHIMEIAKRLCLDGEERL